MARSIAKGPCKSDRKWLPPNTPRAPQVSISVNKRHTSFRELHRLTQRFLIASSSFRDIERRAIMMLRAIDILLPLVDSRTEKVSTRQTMRLRRATLVHDRELVDSQQILQQHCQERVLVYKDRGNLLIDSVR